MKIFKNLFLTLIIGFYMIFSIFSTTSFALSTAGFDLRNPSFAVLLFSVIVLAMLSASIVSIVEYIIKRIKNRCNQ